MFIDGVHSDDGAPMGISSLIDSDEDSGDAGVDFTGGSEQHVNNGSAARIGAARPCGSGAAGGVWSSLIGRHRCLHALTLRAARGASLCAPRSGKNEHAPYFPSS